MATVATPYGLQMVNNLGGRASNGGTIREFRVAANNAAAIFNGDLVALTTAGQPAAVSATPLAINIPSTSANATAGIVGVCVGARYVSSTGQVTHNHFLPAGLITGGASDVWVMVMDDPYAVFRVKGTAALGTFNSGTAGSGWPGAIGKNAALDFNTAGSTSTGNSGVRLLVGTNGGSLAVTSTLATRIVGFEPGTQTDPFPEFLVKFNVGVHSYTNPLGI
jgi:hypothetical protein